MPEVQGLTALRAAYQAPPPLPHMYMIISADTRLSQAGSSGGCRADACKHFLQLAPSLSGERGEGEARASEAEN